MALALTRIEHEPDGPEGAPPLVIAHGLFGSARNFNTLGKRLAQGRRVILVDMRNHGASPWADEMSYPAMAEDLAAVIRDAGDAAGGKAALIGHSMGGKAAMALALSEPGLLAELIVVDIAPVAYAHPHSGYVAAMQGLDLSAVGRRGEADALLAPAIPEAGLRAFILQNLVFEGGHASWRLNLDALAASMDGLIGWPEALAGRRYDGPALFLRGAKSDYADDSRRDAIMAAFPGAAIEAVPDAGHWLHAERPEAFLAAVSAWLSRAR